MSTKSIEDVQKAEIPINSKLPAITGRLTFIKINSQVNLPELGKVTSQLKETSLKKMREHMASPVLHTPKILPRIKK